MLLLVNKVPAHLGWLREVLTQEGYQVLVAAERAEALQLAVSQQPLLVLLDDLGLCRQLKEEPATQHLPTLFVAAEGNLEGLCEGFRAGEVLLRVEAGMEAGHGVRRLLEEREALAQQVAALRAANLQLEQEAEGQRALSLPLRSGPQGRQEVAGFVGQSRAAQVVLEEIALLQQAHTVSVLITGESGTGKEVIARAIHYGGTRASGPFVAVNCAAIPRELTESSFFGHVRGAFTGAYDTRRGYFEQADGGTLFLDEIGDLPLELQAKLLRTLETGSVTPLGGAREKAVDVRILAATNQELGSLIIQDRFREDLYFRLAGFVVAVPPLRERREDIPLLVEHFLRLLAEEMGREPSALNREALRVLEEHEFPGNVRELKNLIEYALIRSRGALIRPEHLRFVEFRRGAGGLPQDPRSGEGVVEQAGKSGGEDARSASPEKQIQAYVAEHGTISNTECRDLLSIEPQRASYLLKKLHGQGLLEQQGSGRWSRYSIPVLLT